MKITKRKIMLIAALVATVAAFGFAGINDTDVKATPNKGIGANIDAPKGADVGDEEQFTIKIKGMGTSAEFVIDFGDDIEYEESEFFAAPGDSWPVENDYELTMVEPGKYMFTAAEFEGDIQIEGWGIFQEDGINTVSVSGTYFDITTGEERTLDVSYDTTVGEGIQEEEEEEITEPEETTEPAEEPEDVNTEDKDDAAPADKPEKSTEATEHEGTTKPAESDSSANPEDIAQDEVNDNSIPEED